MLVFSYDDTGLRKTVCPTISNMARKNCRFSKYMCRRQVTMEGETFYRYGVMLKKVANFYNNMASQV